MKPLNKRKQPKPKLRAEATIPLIKASVNSVEGNVHDPLVRVALNCILIFEERRINNETLKIKNTHSIKLLVICLCFLVVIIGISFNFIFGINTSSNLLAFSGLTSAILTFLKRE